MTERASVFDTAKGFSDFLGFHVRLFFCASVAQIAATIPVSRLLSAWQSDVPYLFRENLLELAVMLVFLSYAIVMYGFILRCGFAFIRSKMEFIPGTVVLRPVLQLLFLLVETGAIFAVVYFSTLQILRLLGIDLAEAECVINAYLSDAGFPLTPDEPRHCRQS